MKGTVWLQLVKKGPTFAVVNATNREPRSPNSHVVVKVGLEVPDEVFEPLEAEGTIPAEFALHPVRLTPESAETA